jgi:hypothetical protein
MLYQYTSTNNDWKVLFEVYARGARFTCFTSTPVQIMTGRCCLRCMRARAPSHWGLRRSFILALSGARLLSLLLPKSTHTDAEVLDLLLGFTCFAIRRCQRRCRVSVVPIYLLYWYKITNTDEEGGIRTTSAFTTSTFGDTQLFFRHAAVN